ncbi:hypothetical protein QKW60_01030 [Defluviimonas aestuarii]|uniref:hypothetical protein n=1 Tax=Albidovulum aestuarii TaxID=1130726 RepID=UPI00249A73D0|nr:hypothetical protein [Defluviimonas aestuarii]MDI3334980.1 hypothetical protein [Defluviimonas aestuarii]
MTSAQGAVPALYILFVLLCAPPLLGAYLGLRRARLASDHTSGGSLFLVGAIFSAAAFLFNFGVTFVATIRIAGGAFEFGLSHAIAAALAWFCFWLWLAMVFLRKRRSRHRIS